MDTSSYLIRYKTPNHVCDDRGVPDDSIAPYSSWTYQVLRLPWSEPVTSVIGHKRLPNGTLLEVLMSYNRNDAELFSGLAWRIGRRVWARFYLDEDSWVPNGCVEVSLS